MRSGMGNRSNAICLFVFLLPLLLAPAAHAKDVAIFSAGHGASVIRDALKETGWDGKIDLINDLSLDNLVQYDVFVLPITPQVTPHEKSKGRQHWRENLRVFVERGGGFVATHDSVGFRYEIKESLFPEVAQGVEKLADREVRITGQHEAITSLKMGQAFQHGYFDHIQLRAGKTGIVLARDKADIPCLVVGQVGSGRTVFLGFGLGVWQAEDQKPPEAEKRITAECIRWAAGGRKAGWQVGPMKQAAEALFVKKQRSLAEQETQQQARAVETRRRVAEAARGKPYLALSEGPLLKVFQDPAMLSEQTLARVGSPEIRIAGCRGEYENYQVILIPETVDLKAVDLKLSELVGPGGAVIPAKHLSKHAVGYFLTRRPKYAVDYVGWWPDVLLPFWTCDVPKGLVQPLWVILHIPDDAAPGEYRGSIEVAPQGLSGTRIPVHLRVWDFQMPKRSFLTTLHHAVPVTGKRRENLLRFCFEHRMCPDIIDFERAGVIRQFKKAGQWDFSCWDDLFDVYRDQITSYVLFSAWGAADREANTAYVRAFADYLRKRGMLQRGVFYMADEPQGDPKKLAKIREEAAWMKAILPELKRLCTSVPDPSIASCVDIWAPHLGEYASLDAIHAEQAKGKECWWYTSTYPAHPWPNKFVDYPAIDHRMIWWLTWRYDVTGYLCTEIATWWGDKGKFVNAKYDYRDVHVPWDIHQSYYGGVNGNHDILFPGPDDTILSSIRAECVRDGIEDYDMFHMLRSAAEKLEKAGSPLAAECRAALAEVAKVAPNGVEWSHNPTVLLAVRQRIAEQLEKVLTTGLP